MVKLTRRVNFINQLELSANELAHIFTNVILFYQQNCAQLYQCIYLEFTPNFAALPTLCARKISVNLLPQKLLVKGW